MVTRRATPARPWPPMRGEVWDVPFRSIGTHPAVVLSNNALRSTASSVTVVLITGTAGPRSTHVPVDASATGRPISYVDSTTIQTVDMSNCRRRRGRLSPVSMADVEDAVALALDL